MSDALARHGWKDDHSVALNLLKFLTAGAVTTALWTAFLLYVLDGDFTAGGSDVEIYTSIILMAVLGAFGVYQYVLPEYTHDWIHRFGKGAVLFMTVNLLVSAGFVIHEVILTTWTATDNSTLGVVMLTWVIGSLFVPGPYVGSLIAARWSDE